MILAWLIAVPLIAGALAWVAGNRSIGASRWIALLALGADAVLALALWLQAPGGPDLGQSSWFAELQWPWIPRFGIGVHLAMDGLSLLMVLLTLFLGIVSVACSWNEIDQHVGFFHANLLWSLAGIIGVFVALDLFLFFFLWEVMLVPMYFLIAIWGHENRIYSAIKFFIFTQASSLLMLASIVGLAYIHYRDAGAWTFDYFELLGTSASPRVAMLLMLGFVAAFAVKLPIVPLHTWLPDAHTDAPTAGSVILAGVLLKTGAYGLIRFVVPLFPDAAAQLAPVAMTLAVVGILYGAVLAFGQTDFKRLVAYTSVSHLGFVLLGVFAWNELALQGAVVTMIAHGLSTGGLFLVAGALQARLHTRDMNAMRGLWAVAPRMGALTMFFAIASLGLPGLANFVGEFLVLLGAFEADPLLAMLAALGLITAVVYALVLIQNTFHAGPMTPQEARAQPEPREAADAGVGVARIAEARGAAAMSDFNLREMSYMASLVVILIWLGLRPQPVLDVVRPVLDAVLPAVEVASPGADGDPQ